MSRAKTFQDIRDIQLCVLIDGRLAFHRDSFRCHRVAESIAQAFNDRLDKARHPTFHRYLEPRPVLSAGFVYPIHLSSG